MNKVETKRTIGSKIVSVKGKIGDIEFMIEEGYDREDFTVYLVTNDRVLGTIDISCSMSQGTGFVDDLVFNEETK